MLNYEKDMKDAFDSAPENIREIVMEIVANFHYRDGKPHEDGSKGTVRISPKQFNDCLAFMFKVPR